MRIKMKKFHSPEKLFFFFELQREKLRTEKFQNIFSFPSNAVVKGSRKA